jgi:hypothetical protein
MALTNEEWKKIEYQATSPMLSAKLLIDGYEIALQAHRGTSPLLYQIMVWVNGKFRGEWLISESPEAQEIRRRFYNTIVKHINSRIALKKMGYRKSEVEEKYKKHSVSHATPLWNTFSRLKRHLVKNNTKISMVVG